MSDSQDKCCRTCRYWEGDEVLRVGPCINPGVPAEMTHASDCSCGWEPIPEKFPVSAPEPLSKE